MGRELAEKMNQPAEEWVDSLEEWLADCLRHWGVKGAIDSEHTPQLTNSMDEQARDAVNALHAIRVLRGHLGSNGNRDWLAREAFRLGRLVERITVRPFEEYVGTGKKQRVTARKGGEATKILNTPGKEKLALETIATHMGGSVKLSPACKRASGILKTEHGIEVSAKVLERLWKKSDNA